MVDPADARSVSVAERLFGVLNRQRVPAEVLAEVRLEVSGLLDDVALRCAQWDVPPSDDAAGEAYADLCEVADLLIGDARSLPEPDAPLRVVLLGRTQAGKSTLFSYLTDSDISPVGDGAQRSTRSVVEMPFTGRSDVVVVDTPGVGAKDGEQDRRLALETARRADLVVWVATNNSQPIETAEALSEVARWGVPMVLVFNCRESLADENAVSQFLAYPDDTFRELDGHRARLARFLDPHGLRPLQVLPVHAAAALLGARSGPAHLGLVQASRVGHLNAAIADEADRRRHQRRAAVIADVARRSLVDAAHRARADGDGLSLVAATRRDAGVDFDRRAERVLADADLAVRGEIEALLRRFDEWADRHYQLDDDDIQSEWASDEGRLRADADELLRRVEVRVRRRLQELDREVAKAWSRRLEFALTRWNQLDASGIAVPRWAEAAARTAAGAVGMVVGGFIGAAVGNAPGAAIGGAIGGAVGERIGALVRLRRGQLARRRSSLQESVRAARSVMHDDAMRVWSAYLDTVRRNLADHSAARGAAIERVEGLAGHANRVADSAVAAVATVDAQLLRALLRLEGRDRLADAVTTVHRRPGFGSVVPVTDPEAFREFTIWPPDALPEPVRPIPAEPNSTSLRRAAFALGAGRRDVVLVGDENGIRAQIPEHLSVEFLAVEAELIASALDVSVDLRSMMSCLPEART